MNAHIVLACHVKPPMPYHRFRITGLNPDWRPDSALARRERERRWQAMADLLAHDVERVEDADEHQLAALQLALHEQAYGQLPARDEVLWDADEYGAHDRDLARLWTAHDADRWEQAVRGRAIDGMYEDVTVRDHGEDRQVAVAVYTDADTSPVLTSDAKASGFHAIVEDAEDRAPAVHVDRSAAQLLRQVRRAQDEIAAAWAMLDLQAFDPTVDYARAQDAEELHEQLLIAWRLAHLPAEGEEATHPVRVWRVPPRADVPATTLRHRRARRERFRRSLVVPHTKRAARAVYIRLRARGEHHRLPRLVEYARSLPEPQIRPLHNAARGLRVALSPSRERPVPQPSAVYRVQDAWDREAGRVRLVALPTAADTVL